MRGPEHGQPNGCAVTLHRFNSHSRLHGVISPTAARICRFSPIPDDQEESSGQISVDPHECREFHSPSNLQDLRRRGRAPFRQNHYRDSERVVLGVAPLCGATPSIRLSLPMTPFTPGRKVAVNISVHKPQCRLARRGTGDCRQSPTSRRHLSRCSGHQRSWQVTWTGG